jgi:4-amino-4-deoxy-L-arabinose transferase-like glycosyltransferase
VTRRRAYTIVILVCALPRLVVLLRERAALIGSPPGYSTFEKSWQLAWVFVHHGVFGYVPGHASAYTQPLYGWFLIPIFWIAGFHWWSVGTAQLVVAVCTSLIVFETGRRFLSARIGVLGACLATLQPYLVWHDLHGNREILDQLLGAAMFGLTLLAAEKRSLRVALLLGFVSGVAILSNARLTALPIVLALFLLWRGRGWAAAVAVPALAVVALAPWVIRNKVDVGCWAITTDARALWKANNVNTYDVLSHGGWIDQVPDIPQRRHLHVADRWRTPEEAHGIWTSPPRHRIIDVPECFQQGHYEHLVFQFWKHHPTEKAKLAAQATWMLWSPKVGITGAQESGVDSVRKWVEPLYMIPLYILAIAGLFFVPPAFRALAIVFALYETAAAWVFAGTTRYRVSWDFVLALLAAAAIDRIVRRVRRVG